jgi:DNA topoisomerase-1
MSNLVIVESPAKCSKIQGYLGPGYKVIASMGHIRALEESLDAIGFDRDFEPKYEFLATKAKALKQLKECAKEAKTVYLASDDDREGEAISYSVALYLKLNPNTTPRIVFHEITEKAIKAAVAAPRRIDMNRVNAQQARSVLDMMIGFTMSPLLWKHVAGGLSAGRCQTPALRLVVEREDQIRNFSAASSWRISGTWDQAKATLDDGLEDEESALNFLELLHTDTSREGKIQSNTTRPWTTNAPQPLITSTLQQQASALFSVGPKAAMMSAQRLYEAGHITYMRTDKAVLSEEAKETIRGYVTTTYGADYVNPLEASTPTTEEPQKKPTKGKKQPAPSTQEGPKAQEAHECIRPTHVELTALPPGEWSNADHRIYGLIWQRAVQSQMAPARGETCTVKLIANAAEDFPWTAQWKRTTFPGWQVAGKVADLDDQDATENQQQDTEASAWTYATTSLKPNTTIKWKQLNAEPHETKAAPRYTEATLVRELEKHGIGRPSTFASLIATIQDKNYVECKNLPGKSMAIKSYSLTTTAPWPPVATTKQKTIGAEKQKLVPTDLGRSALDFMVKHFDDLFNYNFTSTMERRLDKVAEGEDQWKQVVRDMWDSYKERYTDLSAKGSSKGPSAGGEGKVKEFGGGIKAIISKKGPLILYEPSNKEDKVIFYGWPEGTSFQSITEQQVKEFIAQKKTQDAPVGTWRDHPIQKKVGKFGPYAQAGDTIASIAGTDTIEEICAKLDKKAEGASSSKEPLKKFKEYEIHTGQYGPYIIKPALQQRKFVSIPKDLKIEDLKEQDVAALYKAGLEKKSNGAKFAAAKKKKAE